MFDQFYVYILASASGTLYIGVTNDIVRRVAEHKAKINKGFTSTYNCNRLVYAESFYDIVDAIACEKQLKGWKRCRKERLIRLMNPRWFDFSCSWRLPEVEPYEEAIGAVERCAENSHELMRGSSLRSVRQRADCAAFRRTLRLAPLAQGRLGPACPAPTRVLPSDG
jgi:putative endonuclease